MNRLMYVTVLVAMTLGFAACQPKSKKKNVAVATSFNNLTGIYKIPKVTNGLSTRNCNVCTTASDWSTNSKAEYCKRLTNHAANGYCNQTQRQEAFARTACEGTFTLEDPSLQVCTGGGVGKFEHFQLPDQTQTLSQTFSAADIQMYQREIAPFVQRTYPYGFAGFGCSTGMERSWKYNNISDFCQNIQDDTLNAGCAHGVRRQIHRLYCTNQGTVYTPKNPYYQFDMSKFTTKGTNYQLDIFSLIDFSDFSFNNPLKTQEFDCTGVKVATDDKDLFCSKMVDSEFETKCFKPIIESQKSTLNTVSPFETMLNNVRAEVGCI